MCNAGEVCCFVATPMSAAALFLRACLAAALLLEDGSPAAELETGPLLMATTAFSWRLSVLLQKLVI